MPQSDQNKSANTTSAQQAGQGQMSQPSASSAARAKTNNINPSLSTESESAQSTTNGAQNGQDRDQVGDGEAVVGPSKDPLEGFDWDELDERFAAAMDRFRKEEEDVQEEFREWLKVTLSIRKKMWGGGVVVFFQCYFYWCGVVVLCGLAK